MADAVADGDPRLACFVGEFGVVVGAVEVGEHLPPPDTPPEVRVLQIVGLAGQQLDVILQLVTTARVRPSPGQVVGLGDTDRAVPQQVHHIGQVDHEPAGADQVGDLGFGHAGFGTQHGPHRRVTILFEQPGFRDRLDRHGELGLHTPP